MTANNAVEATEYRRLTADRWALDAGRSISAFNVLLKPNGAPICVAI
jgi:hypothetical protein